VGALTPKHARQPVPSSKFALDDDEEELHPPGVHAAAGRRGAAAAGEGASREGVHRGGVAGQRRQGAGEPIDVGTLDDRGLDAQPDVKDFMTIDWTFYNEKDRERRMADMVGSRRSAIYKAIFSVYDAMQSWLALSAIGFISGLLFAMIGTGSDWASDLKFGVCWGRGFWITRNMCCKDSADMLSCPNWLTWAQMLGVNDAANEQIVSYLIYILIAVAQAGYAAWLCATFSPYAVASGIGEIKVILSGFVIKKFLGGWTLLAKCLGLVLSVGSGLSIGKEGPAIHVACCVSNVVSRFFSKYAFNEAKKRELLSGVFALA